LKRKSSPLVYHRIQFFKNNKPAQSLERVLYSWRRGWDLNPRTITGNTLSRRARSARLRDLSEKKSAPDFSPQRGALYHKGVSDITHHMSPTIAANY
jgi:hypothetical protein